MGAALAVAWAVWEAGSSRLSGGSLRSGWKGSECGVCFSPWLSVGLFARQDSLLGLWEPRRVWLLALEVLCGLALPARRGWRRKRGVSCPTAPPLMRFLVRSTLVGGGLTSVYAGQSLLRDGPRMWNSLPRDWEAFLSWLFKSPSRQSCPPPPAEPVSITGSGSPPSGSPVRGRLNRNRDQSV